MIGRLKAVWLALFPGIDLPEQEQFEAWMFEGAYTRIVRAIFALYEEYQDFGCTLSVQAAVAFMTFKLAEMQTFPDAAEVQRLFYKYVSVRKGN